MNFRAVVLRVIALGILHFGKNLLDETLREMDRLAKLHEQGQARARAIAGPKLRIIPGGKP